MTFFHIEPRYGFIRHGGCIGGIPTEISVHGLARHETWHVLEQALRDMTRLHDLTNPVNPTSDIGRINRAKAGDILNISPETWLVLASGEALHRLSFGLFDVAAAAKKSSGQRPFKLLPDNRIELTRPAVLTLGGIAKGYAVDKAVQLLRQAGATSAIVNAGGDIRCFGETIFHIHVRNPLSRQSGTRIIQLKNQAMSIAAARQGFISLINPRTGRKVADRGACITIAGVAMLSDVLTKVVALDPFVAADILDYFDARAIRLPSCREVWCNPGNRTQDAASRVSVTR